MMIMRAFRLPDYDKDKSLILVALAAEPTFAAMARMPPGWEISTRRIAGGHMPYGCSDKSRQGPCRRP